MSDPILDGIFHHEICCQAPDYGPCICRELLHAEIASMRERAVKKEESARAAADCAYAAFSAALEEQKRLRAELATWKRIAAEHEQELEAHATDRVNQRAELAAAKSGLEALQAARTQPKNLLMQIRRSRKVMAGSKEVRPVTAGRLPHMCCDGHQEIAHADSSSEICPLCREIARTEAAERSLEDARKSLREIAFFVPTVTMWQGMQICNVDSVFDLKHKAADGVAAIDAAISKHGEPK